MCAIHKLSGKAARLRVREESPFNPVTNLLILASRRRHSIARKLLQMRTLALPFLASSPFLTELRLQLLRRQRCSLVNIVCIVTAIQAHIIPLFITYTKAKLYDHGTPLKTQKMHKSILIFQSFDLDSAKLTPSFSCLLTMS